MLTQLVKGLEDVHAGLRAAGRARAAGGSRQPGGRKASVPTDAWKRVQGSAQPPVGWQQGLARHPSAGTWWMVTMTVRLESDTFLTARMTIMAARASRPLVGSSRNITLESKHTRRGAGQGGAQVGLSAM